MWYLHIYFEYEPLIWYTVCNFSVGYLFTLLIVKEITLSLFCCLRILVHFIWPCILEFTWGSLFWSLWLCIYFYVSIIPLWFLYLCNVFWNQEMRIDLCSQDYFVYLELLMVLYIFLDLFFFYFCENDINILIGITMNLYLALSSVEMSTVLSLQSMSKIYHANSSCLVSLSQ